MNKEIDFKATFRNIIILILVIINELLYLLFFPAIGFILFYLGFDKNFIITPICILLSGIICIISIALMVGENTPSDGNPLGFFITKIILMELVEYKEQEKEITRIHNPSGWKDD